MAFATSSFAARGFCSAGALFQGNESPSDCGPPSPLIMRGVPVPGVVL